MRAESVVIYGIILFMVVTTATLGLAQNANFLAEQMQEAKNYNSNINVPYLVTCVMPTVVTINNYDKEGNSLSQGSGFFVSPTDIITCYHVINVSNCDQIKILMYIPYGYVFPKNPYIPSQLALALPNFEVPATISEINKQYDLARLTVQSPIGRALPINCNYPMVGEDVFAFGSPYGQFFTVSRGIVSAYRFPWETVYMPSPEDLARYSVDVYANATKQTAPGAKEAFIMQYNAPSSPGNSGGPLVNARGEVVGICDAGLTANDIQNINYAVPSIFFVSVLLNASISACQSPQQYNL